MIGRHSSKNLLEDIGLSEKLLIVQDIDGVCIPLVKDPLKRSVSKEYLITASMFKDDFAVLTCGEHEGPRGVNRIIEKTYKSRKDPKKKGLYLPGLAACAIEYQDKYGTVSFPGVSKQEISFLAEVPKKMKILLIKNLKNILTSLSDKQIEEEAHYAVCDTRFSPTINLNRLFILANNNLEKKKKLQEMLKNIMNTILESTKKVGLSDSFYLHISPNLGRESEVEIMKYATADDIGTTDIQLIMNGALKEAGLLVLLNKYLEKTTGNAPLGNDFNVKEAPKSIDGIIELCKEKIAISSMPRLVGVGDTVTSTKREGSNIMLRGGSDRGFLTLIKRLNKHYQKRNKVIFVDSSHGEVYRPSVKNGKLEGITDENDELKFDLIMNNGPDEYISWFTQLAKVRFRDSPVSEKGL